VCIQALQDAIKFADFLSQSETVSAADHDESSYMYELELSRLVKIYASEERAGRVNIPLAELLRPPFDALLSKLEPERE
jgi:hypothetical protein